MKTVVILGLVILSSLLAFPATAAKPVKEPFHVVYANIVGCGPDCIPDDGIVGPDEAYQWKAEGNLDGTMTLAYETMQSRVARVSAWWKGSGSVTVSIDCDGCTKWAETSSAYKGRKGYHHVEGCLEHYGGTIAVTVTGIARNLAASGDNEMLFRPSTFEC